jgi:hypothetical protein
LEVDVENDTEANMDVDQDQEASEDDLGVLEEPPEVFMTPAERRNPSWSGSSLMTAS